MFLPLALAAAAPTAAQGFQSTAMLDAIVTQFTGRPMGMEGGARAPVDARLKLAACAAPQLEWRDEAHEAVVVRCMAPVWKIYVPVVAAPRPKPVPVAAAPVAAPVKAPEPVIRRGDAIVLEAGASGFSVTREGVAMNDAAPGARVSVKVLDGKAPVQAIAVEPGLARLPGRAD